jgi:hypothetical protein
MNRVILPLIALGALIAMPSAVAQSFRYDGEDAAQRQLRLSRERDEANQQAAKISEQEARLDAIQRQLDRQRKQQQVQFDDLEYQMPRTAPAVPTRPTRPVSPTGRSNAPTVYDRLAEFDAQQGQPTRSAEPYAGFEAGWRAMMDSYLKEQAKAKAQRAREEEREALARGRAIEMAFRAQAEAEAASVRTQQRPPVAPPAVASEPTTDSADYERRANASRDRALQRFPIFANPDSPWRKKLDVYVTQRLEDPARDAYFEKPDWPERIILEFGLRNNLIDAKGNPVVR